MERLREVFFSYVLPFVTLAGIVALWQAGVVLFKVPAYILPTPSSILGEIVQWKELLVGHTWVTLYETLLGFLLAIAIGIPLAIAVVYSRFLQNTIYPLLLVFQSVPKVAIAPIFLIWIGYGISSKVLIAMMVAFFPVVIDTATGLNAVEPDMINLSRSLEASQWQVFRKVRLPFALPFIFSGLKIAVTLAIIGAVIGEFVGSDRGLGYMILEATSQIKTSLVFASILLLSLLGIVLFALLSLLEKILLPWHISVREVVSGTA